MLTAEFLKAIKIAEMGVADVKVVHLSAFLATKVCFSWSPCFASEDSTADFTLRRAIVAVKIAVVKDVFLLLEIFLIGVPQFSALLQYKLKDLLFGDVGRREIPAITEVSGRRKTMPSGKAVRRLYIVVVFPLTYYIIDTLLGEVVRRSQSSVLIIYNTTLAKAEVEVVYVEVYFFCHTL